MSVASPTLLPRNPPFPQLLPTTPRPYPTPLPKGGKHPGRMNSRRDLEKDLADLSAEEEELERINTDIKDRGYKFLVPIGRMLTQEEERADDTESSEEDDDSDDGTQEGSEEEEQSEEEQDLDADMEDMDEEAGNTTVETAITNETAGTDADEIADSDEEEMQL